MARFSFVFLYSQKNICKKRNSTTCSLGKNLFWILLFFCSCSKNALVNPYSYVPSSPSSFWEEEEDSSFLLQDFVSLLPEEGKKEELSLAEIIDISLQNNPNTKISWAEARVQAASYSQSLSSYFPSLSFQGSYLKQKEAFSSSSLLSPRSDSDFQDSSSNYYQITPELKLSYTIFDFGQRKSSSEKALYSLYAADSDHNQQIQSVLKKVMNSYYDYIYQKELFNALQEDVKSAEATLKASEKKKETGVANLSDLAQAKSIFLQKTIEMIQQKKVVDTTFATLATDMGVPAHFSFEVKDLPEKVCQTPMLETVKALVRQAQRKRPDLQTASFEVQASEAHLASAKAASRPILDGSFDVGKNWKSAGISDKYHYNLTLSLSFPIFQGFYYRNGEKKALASLVKSRALKRQKELNVIQDVCVAHSELKSASDSLHYSEEFLQNSELQFTIASQNYLAGVNTILDLLSAQSSLANARAKYVLAKKNWYSSLANLAFATGVLKKKPSSTGKLCKNCF